MCNVYHRALVRMHVVHMFRKQARQCCVKCVYLQNAAISVTACIDIRPTMYMHISLRHCKKLHTLRLVSACTRQAGMLGYIAHMNTLLLIGSIATNFAFSWLNNI